MSNPWFRLYSKIMHDPKIELLSFEDQRHFIWLLCLKNDGFLDEKYKNNEIYDRVLSRKLGLQGEAYASFKERIIDSGLVNKKLQPKQWDTLQFKSDSSAERVRKFRDKKKQECNVTSTVTVTPPDTDTDTDTDTDKKRKNIKKEKRFVKPTVEEMQAYCDERQNGLSAEKIWDFYESKGWMVGKNKMKDWRACIRTWEKSDEKNRQRYNDGVLKKLSSSERGTRACKQWLEEQIKP